MPLTPKNRKEEWLQGLVDHETTLTPKNRKEEWMLGLVEGSTTLTPKNRPEEWLKEIIDAEGGGGGLELLYEDEVTVSTTSTTEQTIETITLPALQETISEGKKMVLFFIFDKAGRRNSHYYGSISAATFFNLATGSSYYIKSDGSMDYSSLSYGVFPKIISTSLNINARYVSSFGTLDGTFAIKIYTLDLPFDI